MKTKQQLTRAIATALFAVTLLGISPALFAQVKIGSNPTVIGTTNNLEVEASTTGRKTSVDKVTGQVTIKDGTEGDAKILTSDASGGASWKTPYSTSLILGQNLESGPIAVSGTNSYTANCPITLNKGLYELYYYVDYYFPSAATASYIYFNFITVSGAALIPSYTWGAATEGPFVVPLVTVSAVGGKVSQMIVVTADNTVIKPHYQASNPGTINYYGKISALKLM